MTMVTSFVSSSPVSAHFSQLDRHPTALTSRRPSLCCTPPPRSVSSPTPSPTPSSSTDSSTPQSSTAPSQPASPPVIFVLGGPGCGKGTQTALLQKNYALAQFCVGDLLRAEAASDTPLGRTVAEIMQRGDIVPGDVTMSLLQRELERLSTSVSAVLIDGFPRAMDQALEFERVIGPCHFVVYFKCEPDVLVGRLRRRAETSGRDDDTEDVFRRRLHTFEDKTMPVIEHYRERGLLREVDAQTGSIEDVFHRTKLHFDNLLVGNNT